MSGASPLGSLCLVSWEKTSTTTTIKNDVDDNLLNMKIL